MRAPEELTEVFRSHGLKVTPQRRCIFEVLYGNETHPSAEAVFDAARSLMPTISLKTVYQTLNDLTTMGEIAAHDLGTGSARFDPNVESAHHHLVCDGCGKVRDLHADVGPLQLTAAQRQGFRVGSAEVVFRGRCRECA